MNGFEEREKGQQAKIKHDDEVRFKTLQRRNKLLGLWAAEKMGITGRDAENYAREVIEADFQKPGTDDLIEKVLSDFRARNIEMSAERLRRQLDRFFAEASEQVKRE